MATQYKQLKETPTDSAGIVLTLTGNEYVAPSGVKYAKAVVEKKSDFFSLVTSVFYPAENEPFYYFDQNGKVVSDYFDSDGVKQRIESLREFGNCFRTEAEAHAAAENIKQDLVSE